MVSLERMTKTLLMKLLLTRRVLFFRVSDFSYVITEEPENPDDAALDQLFSFLDFEDKVNPTSAGYFCKVVNSLLGKRSLEVSPFKPSFN